MDEPHRRPRWGRILYTLVVVIAAIIAFMVLYGIWTTRRTAGRLARWIGPNRSARVLDLGVGRGLLTHTMAQQYPNIVGLDIADKSAFFQPQIYDGQRIPFADKTFDAAICTSVLHHAPNQRELLAELARVTRDTVLIQEDTPAAPVDTLLAQMHVLGEWGGHADLFHGADEWVPIFERAGLRVIHREPVARWDGPLIYPIAKTFFVLRPIAS